MRKLAETCIYIDTIFFAVWGIFKEGKGELFVSQANINENEARRGVINNDVFDWEPNKELFLGESLDTSEATMGEIGTYHTFIEGHGVKLGETWLIKEDLKKASF